MNDDKKFSWFVPWVAGFMFTLGYTFDATNEVLKPWLQALYLLIMYGFWPVILGIHLGGN